MYNIQLLTSEPLNMKCYSPAECHIDRGEAKYQVTPLNMTFMLYDGSSFKPIKMCLFIDHIIIINVKNHAA